MAGFVQEKEGAVVVRVKVVPNSSRTLVAGVLGDALKVKVAQPPEDGKANRAVEELLAEILEVAKGNVAVVSGHSKPRKVVRVEGVDMATVQARLMSSLG